MELDWFGFDRFPQIDMDVHLINGSCGDSWIGLFFFFFFLLAWFVPWCCCGSHYGDGKTHGKTGGWLAVCGSGHTVVWFLYRCAIRILLDVEQQRVVRDGEKEKKRERDGENRECDCFKNF
jgi:hypothetical protein